MEYICLLQWAEKQNATPKLASLHSTFPCSLGFIQVAESTFYLRFFSPSRYFKTTPAKSLLGLHLSKCVYITKYFQGFAPKSHFSWESSALCLSAPIDQSHTSRVVFSSSYRVFSLTPASVQIFWNKRKFVRILRKSFSSHSMWG